MVIYVYIILLIIVLDFSNNKRYNYRVGFIIFLMLLTISSIRSENVGVDLISYLNFFKQYYSIKDIEFKREILFHYLFVFLNQYKNKEILFIVFTSVLTMVPLYLFILKKSPLILLSLLLYIIGSFYLHSFSLIRQSIAISFILWFYYYIEINQYKKSFFFLFIALNFHYSSIISVIALLIPKIKFKLLPTALILISTALIGLSGIINIRNFLDILETINLPIAKYSMYIDYGLSEDRNFLGRVQLIVPPSFLALYAFTKNKDDFYSKLYIIGISISNLIVTHAISYRMSMYFSILIIIIFPRVILNQKNSKRNWILNYSYIAILVFFTVYGLYKLTQNQNPFSNQVVPYQIYL